MVMQLMFFNQWYYSNSTFFTVPHSFAMTLEEKGDVVEG